MAANIEMRTIGGREVASFVETQKGAGAWHGLGEKVQVSGDTGINIIEALEKSHANYNVELQPLVCLTPELVEAMTNDQMINAGELLSHIVKGVKGTMRTDFNECLGTVSDGYGVIQNSRMFQMLGLLCSGKDMNREDVPVVETAGVLGKGERCFVSMKMPEPIRLGTKKDDDVNMYLLAQNSFDGSSNFSVYLTPIRTVCQNTLALAISMARSRISFRHTRLVNDRIDLLNKDVADMAYRTLGLYDVYKQHFEAELEHLRNIKLGEKDMEKILAEALMSEDAFKAYEKDNFNMFAEGVGTRSRNVLTAAMDSLESGVGQDNRELAGTGLYLINGITTYFQNTKNWNDKEKKFVSITEGDAYNKLQKAYNLVLQAA
jgi:phage/plasmid-like protein (TIGR03299 family)